MGKIWVEVSLISARGLRRSSSLWKLQWYAVGWIDPNNKYCTKIDACGNANPVWRTKFAEVVDESNFQDLALHLEVYCREPLFLTERLQGTATVLLKEFLTKYSKSSESSRPGTEEVGSYQLRKRNSNKLQGFIDISIRVSEERDDPCSYPGNEGGIMLMDHSNNNTLTAPVALGQAYPTQLPLAPLHPPENQPQPNFLHNISQTYLTNYSNPSAVGPSYTPVAGPSYNPPRTPPPPPPPSNVGYIPTFIPRTDLSTSYINMPSSGPPTRGMRSGLAAGVGAGALAAGAVIFGDDFMSGFDASAGLKDASLTISTDPPF